MRDFRPARLRQPCYLVLNRLNWGHSLFLFVFQEAVKREVLEESGLEFEPEALIAVECGSYQWVRFTLTGQYK